MVIKQSAHFFLNIFNWYGKVKKDNTSNFVLLPVKGICF